MKKSKRMYSGCSSMEKSSIVVLVMALLLADSMQGKCVECCSGSEVKCTYGCEVGKKLNWEEGRECA